jgi:hypothetical protein
MISIYGRKSTKHRWDLLGRTSYKNRDYINIVYSIFRDDISFLVGYIDDDESPDKLKASYQFIHNLPIIDYETALKLIDFIETGIISINPPLFSKCVSYGLLQY